MSLLSNQLNRHRVWLIVSLCLTVVITLPGAFVATPHIVRWRMMSRINSDESADRQIAFNYIMHHVGDDPRVLAACISLLDTADTDRFLDLMNALDQGGQWRLTVVGDQPWIRWLEILSSDLAEESRIHAAQIAADAPELARNNVVTGMFERLIADSAVDVRYNAMVAMAEMAGAVGPGHPFEAALHRAAGDANPTIARQAWLILGSLRPESGVTANWRDADAHVAPAMLWAAVTTNPDQPRPALDALADQRVSPALRGMAAYMLGMRGRRVAGGGAVEAMFDRLLSRGPGAVNEDNALLYWRVVLTTPPLTALHRYMQSFADPGVAHGALLPVALAAQFRLGSQAPLPPTIVTPAPIHELMALAHAESGDPVDAVPDNAPDMLRMAIVASMREPAPDDLLPVFDHEAPALRDRACVIAGDRFTPEQNTALIAGLLADYNDRAKMSGAVLAGLTGLQTSLLERKHGQEDNPQVQQVMELGLWMQGKRPEFDCAVSLWLTHDDLPATTILLAKLHRRRAEALDDLLNPRGELTLDLVELLDHYRWWYVLKHYLPEDAPPFWVWADPQLEQFQIDVLRNWYLVNRHRFRAEGVR